MTKFLVFAFTVVFSASLSAQQLPSVKTSDLKKDGIEALTKGDSKMDTQIKSALMKDEGLQKEAISYLKSNPDAVTSLAGILKNSDSSNSKIMSAILENKELTKMAIDYVSKNPKLLKKAMGLLKM